MSASTPPPAARPWSVDRLRERAARPLLPRDFPLVLVAIAVGFGAVVEPAFGAMSSPPGFLLAAAALLLTWLGVRRRAETPAALALLLAIACVAAGWSAAAWRWFEADDVGRFASREASPAALDVVALDSPARYPAELASPFRAIPSTERSVLLVKVERIRDGRAWRDASGRSELTVIGRLDDVRPGERLRVFGQLRRPTVAMNPGERDASLSALAERRLSVIWTEATACVQKLDTPTTNIPTASLDAWRTRLRQNLTDRLSDENAAIVAAMLLGDRSSLSRSTVDAFRRVGALHVLVVSGLHMGLVAGIVLGVARLGSAPRAFAAVGCLIVVLGYTTLTGAAPPATRAAVLAAAACVAWLLGRRAIGPNSLAGAAIVVFGVSPGAWHSDGTKLSFLSAATLLAIAAWASRRSAAPKPPLERLIERARSRSERFVRATSVWLGWLLLASAAVLVVTWPLLASRFHLLSPIAVPLSVVMLPLVWVLVGSGLATIVAATLFDGPGGEAIATMPALICESAASLLLKCVEAAASAPFAAFYTAGPTEWWVVVCYAALAVSLPLFVMRPDLRWLVPRIALAVVAAGVAPPAIDLATRVTNGPQPLRCSFLAVGHGAATLLETPGGGVILCDAGALGSPERVSDTIARVLWSRGVSRLDAVVLSHADVDHYNALPGLLERMPVEAVWTSELMFPRFVDDTDHSAPAELRRLLDRRGVAVRTLRTGDRLRVGQPTAPDPVRIEVLHPTDLGVAGSDNANSLVLAVEHTGRRLLLTGDLESPGLDLLLTQEPYDCDLLVAPHHGSERSDPPGLAEWCRPELVVISSGAPRTAAGTAYRKAGASVRNTYDTGLLAVEVSQAGLSTAEHRGGWPRRKAALFSP